MFTRVFFAYSGTLSLCPYLFFVRLCPFYLPQRCNTRDCHIQEACGSLWVGPFVPPRFASYDWSVPFGGVRRRSYSVKVSLGCHGNRPGFVPMMESPTTLPTAGRGGARTAAAVRESTEEMPPLYTRPSAHSRAEDEQVLLVATAVHMCQNLS